MYYVGNTFFVLSLLDYLGNVISNTTERCNNNIDHSSSYNGVCYWLIETKQEHHPSHELCHANGGYLALVPDNGALSHIEDLIDQSGFFGEFYIGYYLDHSTSDPVLRTLTGDIQTFAPFQHDSHDDSDECVTLYNVNFYSVRCTKDRRVVCADTFNMDPTWPGFPSSSSQSTPSLQQSTYIESSYTSVSNDDLTTSSFTVTSLEMKATESQYISTSSDLLATSESSYTSLSDNGLTTSSFTVHVTSLEMEATESQYISISSNLLATSESSYNSLSNDDFTTSLFTSLEMGDIETQYTSTASDILTTSISESTMQDIDSSLFVTTSLFFRDGTISSTIVQELESSFSISTISGILSTYTYDAISPLSVSSVYENVMHDTQITTSNLATSAVQTMSSRLYSDAFNLSTDVSVTTRITPETATETIPSTSYHSMNITCKCKCAILRLFPSHYPNMSTVQERLSEVANRLKVNKESLSSTKRKKISAADDRPSSTGIGIVGIFILLLVFGPIVIADVLNGISYLQDYVSGMERFKSSKHSTSKLYDVSFSNEHLESQF